jgi:hypothetical protein
MIMPPGAVSVTTPRPTTPPPPLEVDPAGPDPPPLQAANPTVTTTIASLFIRSSVLQAYA